MVDIEEPLGEVVKDEVRHVEGTGKCAKCQRNRIRRAHARNDASLLAERRVVLMRILENYHIVSNRFPAG